ncbi:MAG: DNA translocase FtsK 4TM domain-containing protein, partial [Planctomycetota bacterium]
MKKKKSYSKISERETTHSGARTALACFGIGVCLVLLCSCLSFDIGDWPSKFAFPHNAPPANWCGSIGAFCAYYLLYYIGPGVFVILASAICFLVAKIALQPTGQPVFRAIGLGLMTVAVSTSFHCLWPHRFFSFPMGSGGVLGVGAAQFLRSYFASLGTFILIGAIWVVGILLLADSFALMVLGWFGFMARKMIGMGTPAWSVAKQQSQVVNEIWKKLSARQKPLMVGGETVNRLAGDVARQLDNIPVKRLDGEKMERPSAQPSRRSVAQPSYEDYELPPFELLAEPEYGFAAVQEKVVKAKASALETLLSEFSINARVVAADTGPVVT